MYREKRIETEGRGESKAKEEGGVGKTESTTKNSVPFQSSKNSFKF